MLLYAPFVNCFWRLVWEDGLDFGLGAGTGKMAPFIITKYQ